MEGESALRIGMGNVQTLDPARAQSPQSLLLVRNVFETLVRFDPTTLELQAGLAASWEATDGGRRFIFRLRPDASFHNGTLVTSTDVLFSLNRLAARATGSPWALLLEDVLGFERVHTLGLEEEMEGVKAIDENTFEIQLEAEWYDFPYVLTHPATAVISKRHADPKSLATNPVGSGEYRIVGRQGARRIELESVSEAPAIGEVTISVYDGSAHSLWNDFENRKLDIADVPSSQISKAMDQFGPAGFKGQAAALYLGVNLRKPVLQDPRLRRGLSFALDREKIAREVFQDTLMPAAGLLPEAVKGSAGARCGDLCRYAPSNARSLVEEIFGTEPPQLTLDYLSDPLGESVRGLLEEAGLRVEFRGRQDLFELLAGGDHDLFLIGWNAGYPLAEQFLRPLFESGSLENYVAYSNPEVDRLLRESRGEADEGARLKKLAEVEKIVSSEMALIPLGQVRSHLAAQGVDGFRLDALGLFAFAELSFDAP